MTAKELIFFLLVWELLSGNPTVNPNSIDNAALHAERQLALLGQTTDTYTWANALRYALSGYGIQVGARPS